MGKRKTHDMYIAELADKNPNIEVLGKYAGSKTKILHRCKLDNYEWDISPEKTLCGCGCPKCAGNLKKTHEDYVAEVKIKNHDIQVMEKYIGINTPIMHYCLKHNTYWKVRPIDILHGKGCKLCAREKISISNRMEHNEYVRDLAIKNPTVEVVGEYINAKTKIVHHCLKHDVYWEASPDKILHGQGCNQCAKEKYNKSRSKDHDKYVNEVAIVNPNIMVIGQYAGHKTSITHYCKMHNIYWDTPPDNVLSGRGCCECGKEKIADKKRKTLEQYVLELAIINPDIEIIEQYIGTDIPALHRCKIDGHEWMARPANVLNGRGCPRCKESIGERKVRRWLESNNITYIYQKSFTTCRDKKELPFDFYLPDYNVCIEYDGEQHFRPVDFSGKGYEWAIKQFNQTKRHDEIKNKYCMINNIHLLRIPYYKNVEEELNNFIHLTQ